MVALGKGMAFIIWLTVYPVQSDGSKEEYFSKYLRKKVSATYNPRVYQNQNWWEKLWKHRKNLSLFR